MTAERIGALAAMVLVAGGVAGGLALLGTPQHQRELQIDRRRIADLRTIAAALNHRYAPQAHVQRPLPQRLPKDLGDGYPATTTPVDPVSGTPYTYVRESASRYRLCATFAQAAASDGGYNDRPHGAGTRCFRFEVTGDAEPRTETSRS